MEDYFCRSCGEYYDEDSFCFDCERCNDCCLCNGCAPNEDKVALVCPVCHKSAYSGKDSGRHTCRCLYRMMSQPPGVREEFSAYPHFNPKRTFGVEIECYGGNTGRCTLQERLRVLAVEKYGDAEVVDVGTDPSINDGAEDGIEVRIGPICGDSGLALVARVLLCLQARGYTVNSTCGLHIHHDIAHTRRRKRQLVMDIAGAALNFYGRYQQQINNFCREYRNGSPTYCAGISSTWRASDAIHGSRYTSLNLTSLQNWGTLEFRQHHATMVPASVIGWILFTQLIVEKAANCRCRVSHESPSMRELWRRLVDPKDARSVAVRKFFLAQARHLAQCECRPAPRFSMKKKEKD